MAVHEVLSIEVDKNLITSTLSSTHAVGEVLALLRGSRPVTSIYHECLDQYRPVNQSLL